MRRMVAARRKSTARLSWRRDRTNSVRFIRQNRAQRRPGPQPTHPRTVEFSCGATCAGVLLQRMRLHLITQRFLAGRRGDRIWEVSCDYASLSLERLVARMRPGMFEQPLIRAREAQ